MYLHAFVKNLLLYVASGTPSCYASCISNRPQEVAMSHSLAQTTTYEFDDRHVAQGGLEGWTATCGTCGYQMGTSLTGKHFIVADMNDHVRYMIKEGR